MASDTKPKVTIGIDKDLHKRSFSYMTTMKKIIA